MKKKILIISLIIILSFALGLGIRFLTIFIKNKQIEKNYTTFIGAVENIDDKHVYILSEDESLKKSYEQLYFSISEHPEQTWKIGDKLEIKFHKEFISDDGFMGKTIQKYLGKTRLFKNLADIPVSNSGFLGGNLVNKSIYQYEETFNLDEFTQTDDYFIKKIISYDEYLKYQKLIPEIRSLTEDDFINYYLLVILSTDSSSLYTLNEYDESETGLTLSILKHQTLSSSTQDTKPIFSGLSVVVPNRCDFDLNKITFETISTK